MQWSYVWMPTVGLVILGVEANLARTMLGGWIDARRENRVRRARRQRHECSGDSLGSARFATGVRILGFAAGLALAATVCHAQEPAQSQDQQPLIGTGTKAPEPASVRNESESRLSLQFNLDVTNAYFYHGIVQEDTGFIVQPAVRVTANLINSDDFKLDAFIGTWNSFHSQKTGARTHGDFSEYWYESDLLGGFTITKDKLSLTTSYIFLTSPSDAYATVQELDLNLALDDSEWLGKWAVKPYALLAIETGADASDGAESDTGTYLELGIGPGFAHTFGGTEVSFTFPVSVGLSLHNYYQNALGEDDTFGFAQAGVKAAVPLPFGNAYGKWVLNAGVSALFLGDHTSEYNNGEDFEVIATLGVQVNF